VILLTIHENILQGNHKYATAWQRDILRGREQQCLRRFSGGIEITATDVGGRSTITTKTMTNGNQFTLANRKQIADMLGSNYGSLREKVKDRFRGKAHTLYNAFLNEYAEKKGALAVVAKLDAAKNKLQELRAELSLLGFELDNSGLALAGGSSNPLDKIIDQRVAEKIGTIYDLDARFDSAQVAVMTAATLEDADKLVRSVSEVQ
jgi:hypothetical protein